MLPVRSWPAGGVILGWCNPLAGPVILTASTGTEAPMNSRLSLFLSLLPLLAGVASSQAGASGAAPAKPAGRIEGRVVTAPQGEPRLQAIELYPSGARFPTASAAPDGD